jgi:hypothetical protein
MRRFLYPFLLWVLFGLLGPAGGGTAVYAADTVFGGEVSFNTGFLLYRDRREDVLKNRFYGLSEFGGILNVYSDTVELFFRPEFSFKLPAAADAGIDQLYLKVYPADFFTLQIGRFYHLPGVANLFSVNNFFHRFDYESLLLGNLSGVNVPNDMVQAGFFLPNVYFKGTVAPFPVQPEIMEASSPWFPLSEIPEEVSFVIEDGSEQTYELSELTALEAAQVTPQLRYLSAAAEIGAAVSYFDVFATYYHGVDNDLLLEARLILPLGYYGGIFDLEIKPVYAAVDAFGLNTVFSIGGLRVWAEGAFSVNKTFATAEISPASKRTIYETNPYLETTGGISYQFSRPLLLLSAEYTDGWAFGSEYEHITLPAGPLLSFMAGLDLLDGTVQIREVFLLSAEDWSFVFNSAVTFRFENAVELQIIYPFFAGGSDTAFGQYRLNVPLSIGVSWRF